MSLELKKEIMKPKSPADMALKYWKKQAKDQRSKLTLKHYYLQKQLLEMFNIKSDSFGNPITDLSIDVAKELNKEVLENSFKLFFSGDDFDLKRNLESVLMKSQEATEKYTSRKLEDLSIPEKIDAMFEAFKSAESIAVSNNDPDVKASAIEDVKNITFAASALFITGSNELKSAVRESSEKHFGSSSFFEDKIAVGMNSEYLKSRLNNAFSMIENNQFNIDSSNEINNSINVEPKKKRGLKLKK